MDRPADDPLLLDSYAARSCPVKTQNVHDPRWETPVVEDAAVGEWFSGGEDRRAAVLDRLVDLHPAAVDLRPLRGRPWQERQAATLAAVAAGAPLVLDATLPADREGHRRGRCELLVRERDGHLPVLIKNYLVRERSQRGGQQVSGLVAPWLSAARELPELDYRWQRREGAVVQLAHFLRMLQAAGLAPSGPDQIGGVIGTDDPTGITWIDLAAPVLRTFSRSSEAGWRMRSPLQRHDHEHRFRVAVAERAHELGRPGVHPMVQPIRVGECETCVWWQICEPQLGADDISLRIDRAPLDVREISVLRSRGIRTTADLAGMDLEAFLPGYLPEVTHRAGSERRLRLAQRRARLVAEGVELERLDTGTVVVPQAQIEIDFDIETSADGRVYLWGFLVNDMVRGGSEYREFSAFGDLDAAGELALARRAMGWLLSMTDTGRSVRVYHYSDFETVKIAQLAEASGDPLLARVSVWAREHWTDLYQIVRDNLFGLNGLGLKVVASAGAGFRWRDEDPGGLNSQSWFDDAVHAPTAEDREMARVRVLEYNEDDVRATEALRRWLRSLR